MATKRQRKSHLRGKWECITDTSAWRALPLGARLLWIELRRHLCFDHTNNGKLYLSDRDAAKIIGASKNTIVRWYGALEHYGFIAKTCGGFLGADGRGIATHYRFTYARYGTHAPTMDFKKWDGTVSSRPRRRSSRKQNPVPTVGTPLYQRLVHTAAPGGDSVCTNGGYIDPPPRCTNGGYILRSATLQSAARKDQGSSTVRAPAAQAGDAGSSPAPEAKPDLTAMVLEIVNAEPDAGIVMRLMRGGPAVEASWIDRRMVPIVYLVTIYNLGT
jgi:hypothetical protein